MYPLFSHIFSPLVDFCRSVLKILWLYGLYVYLMFFKTVGLAFIDSV